MTTEEKIQTAYEKVLSTEPSAESKNRLMRLKESMGFRDDDAIWGIIFALEFYSSIYDSVPDKMRATVADILEDFRTTAMAIAEQEVMKSQATLAAAVVNTSEQIAGKRVAAARWLSWASIISTLVVFGTVCFSAGLIWRRNVIPESNITISILRKILYAPAGWILVIILGAPLAIYVRNSLKQLRFLPSKREKIKDLIFLTAATSSYIMLVWLLLLLNIR